MSARRGPLQSQRKIRIPTVSHGSTIARGSSSQQNSERNIPARADGSAADPVPDPRRCSAGRCGMATCSRTSYLMWLDHTPRLWLDHLPAGAGWRGSRHPGTRDLPGGSNDADHRARQPRGAHPTRRHRRGHPLRRSRPGEHSGGPQAPRPQVLGPGPADAVQEARVQPRRQAAACQHHLGPPRPGQAPHPAGPVRLHRRRGRSGDHPAPRPRGVPGHRVPARHPARRLQSRPDHGHPRQAVHGCRSASRPPASPG